MGTCLIETARGTRLEGSRAWAASSMTKVSKGTVTFRNREPPLNARVAKTMSALSKIAFVALSTCSESELAHIKAIPYRAVSECGTNWALQSNRLDLNPF